MPSACSRTIRVHVDVATLELSGRAGDVASRHGFTVSFDRARISRRGDGIHRQGLHPVFAAELVGADLRVAPSEDLVRTVEHAMAQYGVLVIRVNRSTTRSTSVSAGRSDRSSCRRTWGCRPGRGACGASCTTHRTSTPTASYSTRIATPQVQPGQRVVPHRQLVQRPPHQVVAAPRPRVAARRREHRVHRPARAVYAALPPATKARLDGLVAEHNLWHSREQGGFTAVTER